MMDAPPDPEASDRDQAIREWLDEVAGPSHRTAPASSDASFRRYLRVTAGGQSFILMDAPPEHEDCRPFLHVRSLLESAGVNVPAVVNADVQRGLLLLTDFGSCSYLDVLKEGNCERLYADAMDTLVRMQARVAAGAVENFDREKLSTELRLFPDWFLREHLALEIADDFRRRMQACFDSLIERCLEQPQVFVHRDYHSRNLMRVVQNNPGVLDFQDAVAGPVTYDLVSLFRDVYIEWPPEKVAAWVAGYHARARGVVDQLAQVDLDTFQQWFDLTGVQRHIKVAGIFCRLWHRDGKPGYLRDVPLTLRYLMAVGARYKETAGFIDALRALGVEQRFAAALPSSLGR
jgi:aminoglycoside/choline kinase family phosphotransferase